ncbi:zinc-ribbon domain-containing protein [Microbacterium festucae]|uniref:zinc-ribbon domain-containing protein n=1 Tax=Microbacterium festucae TaxID=2977531 RepID=UPI0036F44C24
MLLRPVGSPGDPHAFSVATGTGEGSHEVEMRSCAWPRQMHEHLSQVRFSRAGLPREDAGRVPHAMTEYSCRLGHHYRSRYSRLENATGGCPYCSNRKTLIGFNSLQDTHPDVLAEWDYNANTSVQPTELQAGSGRKVAWRCSDGGHLHYASPATRVKQGSRCGVCVKRIIDPDANTLAHTHPHLASRWHPALNASITPESVTSGSRGSAWWVCDRGHAYAALIRSQVRCARCPFCSRRLAHPSTSLLVTHPEVAETLHPVLNGALSANDVLAGSSAVLWWRCASSGHVYQARVYNRVRTATCPGCRVRRR